jgi:AmmeMemoRadiSam system protein B
MRLAAAFDGLFYPAEPGALGEMVDSFLSRAPHPPTGPLLGAVVPHAGYVYSGRTAGAALGTLRDTGAEAVVVLGPSHRVPVRGVRVFRVEGYESPLGPIPSDPDLADELAARLGQGAAGAAFAEHSVEVQRPFLARVLPGVPLVELVFGPPDPVVAVRVAEVLQALAARRRLVVVASTDLSHYHRRGQARFLDDRFHALLRQGDPEAMARGLSAGEAEACGAGPVLTLMELTRRVGGRFEVVEQTDSSEASGDEEKVVGYLSALAVGLEAVE